jgi:integrase
LDVLGSEAPIRNITREECREFLNLLVRMPAFADKRYRGLSLREAVAAAAEQPEVRIITAANVNAHLIRFNAVMNWALDEGYIERNPARRLRISDPVPRRDKRHPFSARQLQAIFAAPLYTGCEDDWCGYAKRGEQRPRRSRFWVPLIALFSGMRLNEICQLDTADVVLVEGIECFRVTANSRSQSGKRIKTAASERLVPVHPELQRIGFHTYVNDRLGAGDLKLFPDLRVSSLGYHSVTFSKWFTRFLRSADAAVERTCFHSFRHNFRDALREAKVPREIALLLGGWASSGGASAIADIYGNGVAVSHLAEYLAQVRYACLSLAHLHQSEDAQDPSG